MTPRQFFRWWLFQRRLDLRRAWIRVRCRFDPEYAARHRRMEAMAAMRFDWPLETDAEEGFVESKPRSGGRTSI